MLLAVCEKLLSLGLTSMDCFINVIGGLKVSDPATDLAVCIAAVSSARGVSVRPNTLILGEVGLSGEIRPVSRIVKRCTTAAKLGITTVVLPGCSKEALEKELSGISRDAFGSSGLPEFIYADNLKEAVDILFS
jgi:DNA repair protein RadA/Sms